MTAPEKPTSTRRGLLKLWKERHKLSENRLSTDLKSFLPPSLEVMEKPPHPAPRIILAIICGICVVGLIWAIVGKVDVITVAEGKIIPSGQIKQIQPYDRGVVSRIAVVEDQVVEAGETLIELDRTQTTAEEIRLTGDDKFAREKRGRREIMISLLRQKIGGRLKPLPGSPSSVIEEATAADSPDWSPAGEAVTDEEIINHPALAGDRKNGLVLLEEYKTVVSQWQTLESQLEERRAEWASSQEIIKQLTATLPLVEQRLTAYKSLFERKMVTMNEYLALEEERLRQFHGLESEKARSAQLTAAINSMEKQLAASQAQSLSEALNELDELSRQSESITQELAKVKDLGAKQILYAPVRGTVKGLVVNTVGGVVEPAQVIMELVPIGETLEVEAFITNQDIGYVQVGQSAEVKINTFPFTKYGVIDAVVENVADDATVDEKLGLIYRAKLVLAKNTIMVDGREVPLLPGMAVTAEIATDQRRLIEFFLAPLLRMKAESLRER